MDLYHMTDVQSAIYILNDAYHAGDHEFAAMSFINYPANNDDQNIFIKYGFLMCFSYDENRLIRSEYNVQQNSQAGRIYYNGGDNYYLCPTKERTHVGLVFRSGIIITDDQRDYRNIET